MDWKAENPRKRYIDDITDEEATVIARLAMGVEDDQDFELIEVKSWDDGNNIPHVRITFYYYEVVLHEMMEGQVGIFHNLNTYTGAHFHSPYCQKEIFKKYKEFGFE